MTKGEEEGEAKLSGPDKPLDYAPPAQRSRNQKLRDALFSICVTAVVIVAIMYYFLFRRWSRIWGD